MKIKICGINRPVDVQYINQSQPDYVGFIVNFPKSHRSVDYNQLRALAGRIDAPIKKVGVFVDESAEQIAQILNEEILDIAQLHGKQEEDFIKHLRSLTNKEIWKAFAVESEDDLLQAEASSADLVLLDNKGGGTGQAFDHSLIKKFPRPYLLAGGMDEETIPLVLDRFSPMGIDTSSGTETNKKKDPKKIENIIRMVRNV
ncbi:MAG: phosphoribosylanthranilate isomerase [Atopococcus tabaci]|uniref:N-(5'-phosphoribosyl)anthranilate isomerase n=1 Tax=Atopococcus tabaci TaxID=269774 RepID=A0AA43UBY3_9LACT|nr:phosphoribosylanthranilate isomerase [Atopococcus tabaci]